MSEDDPNRNAAGEPFAWAFHQQLPGRLGSVVLCTVRTREEADDLRGQGIEIFPLYSEAALRRPPAPTQPDTASRGVPWPSHSSAPGTVNQPPTEYQRVADSESAHRPPLPPDIFGLPSGANDPPSASEMPWKFSARARPGERDLRPPPAANSPMPATSALATRNHSLLREVLRPFAQMAALVEGQDEDETVLSLQAGPLQWRHLTVGDLRRARSLYLASES